MCWTTQGGLLDRLGLERLTDYQLTMVDLERDAFFVLKVKCPVVAARLQVAEGDSVLYYLESP